MSVKAPTRRWLQFGLGSLLGLMLLAALFLGYTAWWMRRLDEVQQRNEALVKQLQDQQQRAEEARRRAEEARLIRLLNELRLQEATAGAQGQAPDEGEAR